MSETKVTKTKVSAPHLTERAASLLVGIARHESGHYLNHSPECIVRFNKIFEDLITQGADREEAQAIANKVLGIPSLPTAPTGNIVSVRTQEETKMTTNSTRDLAVTMQDITLIEQVVESFVKVATAGGDTVYPSQLKASWDRVKAAMLVEDTRDIKVKGN